MSDPTSGTGPTLLIPPQHMPQRPGGNAPDLALYRRTESQARPHRNDPAWKQSVEFEAVFLSQMLEHMFTATEVDPPFGGGHAEETWRSLMNQEYGRAIARAGGVGIADHVYKTILRLQEV